MRLFNWESRPAIVLGGSNDPAYFVQLGEAGWTEVLAVEVFDSGREISHAQFVQLFPDVTLPTAEQLGSGLISVKASS